MWQTRTETEIAAPGAALARVTEGYEKQDAAHTLLGLRLELQALRKELQGLRAERDALGAECASLAEELEAERARGAAMMIRGEGVECSEGRAGCEVGLLCERADDAGGDPVMGAGMRAPTYQDLEREVEQLRLRVMSEEARTQEACLYACVCSWGMLGRKLRVCCSCSYFLFRPSAVCICCAGIISSTCCAGMVPLVVCVHEWCRNQGQELLLAGCCI